MTAQERTQPDTETPFGSNAVRLTTPQWLVALVLLAGLLIGIPATWKRVEPFEPGADYRTPYDLSNDYWQYNRYCEQAVRQDKVLVVGDSAIWGEYVKPDQTLSYCLNQRVGEERFANMGVNGIHPVALAGLIAYYGRAITSRDVVLHYNPLWMSSKQHDLQAEKEFRFNHPKLVPQFLTRIPCYKDPYAQRIGIVAERYFPFRAWANHVAIAYFENTDLATWAIENPYANPLSRITLELPQPKTEQRHTSAPWYETGKDEVNFEWVDPASSLQWRSFQEAVRTLRARQNNLFVIVGPFNEHMISNESRKAYQQVKDTIEARLIEHEIPHYIAPALPSALYADASHPLREGYASIARQLLEQDAFRGFLASCTSAQNP